MTPSILIAIALLCQDSSRFMNKRTCEIQIIQCVEDKADQSDTKPVVETQFARFLADCVKEKL